MTRDISDATAEARLRAALTDRYPLEPVDDAQLGRVMHELASGAAPTEPFAVLPLAAPARRRGWTTALLAAAVAVIVALVGVSATLLLADGSSSSPAISPTVPVATGEAPATPTAPTTSGASTSAAPSVTVPLSTLTPDRSPAASPVETPPPAAPDPPTAGPPTTEADPATSPPTGGAPTDAAASSPPVAAPSVPPSAVPSSVAPSSADPAAETVAADPQEYRVDDTQFEVPGMIHFVSPSGNIRCMMADNGVPGADCAIEEADFPHLACAEPTPALALHFFVHNAGQTADLRTTPPDSKGGFLDSCDFSSAGSDEPSQPDGTPPLPYGSSLTLGATTCVSETTGITCRSLISGAGFEVSRTAYRLF